jgi:Peptidase family M23
MIRTPLIAMLALSAASQTQAAEIRICEHEIRTAPLSDERGVQSALVQGFAVVNTSGVPEKLTGVVFQLKEKDQLRDWRWLLPADIAKAAKQAPQIEMLAQILPPQFCNGKMLDGAKLAKSDTLAPGEALVFMYQPFVWSGTRDQLVITASTERGGEPHDAKLAIPVVMRVSKTKILFPLEGRSFVPVAAGFHTPHRWAAIEEFALDILALSDKGSTYRGKGTKLTDYAAFGKPVRAVADGKVVAASDGIADNAAMLKRPGEANEAYLNRLQEGQMALLAKGMTSVLGNHVVIDHGNGEFSIYAHLKQGSVRIAVGAQVKSGDVIAALGSSGNSTEPHLHFQMCDGPDIATCRPIPATFTGYRLPFELSPRSIQSGDIVETVE